MNIFISIVLGIVAGLVWNAGYEGEVIASIVSTVTAILAVLLRDK